METMMQWAPLLGLWIATFGTYVVACLALYAYRARRWPPLNPLYVIVSSGFLFWLATQQPDGILAGSFFFGAGWGAFIAGGFAGSELHSLSDTKPDSAVAKHS